MDRTKSYLLQFYQKEPQDSGIDDIPMETEDCEREAQKILLGYANNKTISPLQCPHCVRLVKKDDMSVIFTLKAISAQAVEKIPNATGSSER